MHQIAVVADDQGDSQNLKNPSHFRHFIYPMYTLRHHLNCQMRMINLRSLLYRLTIS